MLLLLVVFAIVSLLSMTFLGLHIPNFESSFFISSSLVTFYTQFISTRSVKVKTRIFFIVVALLLVLTTQYLSISIIDLLPFKNLYLGSLIILILVAVIITTTQTFSHRLIEKSFK